MLQSEEVLALVRDAATLELGGGVMHDAVIARVARRARVERLLTFHVMHFRRAWPDGADRISAP